MARGLRAEGSLVGSGKGKTAAIAAGALSMKGF
jgi:hypothetical protein